MNARVIITIRPKRTSYFKTFLLKKIGSKNAENNDEVDKQITAHCTDRDGVLKKKSRGVYELKSKYILLNDDKNQQKPIGDWDYWGK